MSWALHLYSQPLLWEPHSRLPSLCYPRAVLAQVTPRLLRTAGWPGPVRLSFCELLHSGNPVDARRVPPGLLLSLGARC